MTRDDDEHDEGRKPDAQAAGRQPQHPGQPARYTGKPGDRDPGALAKEGKADAPVRSNSDSRDARTSGSLAGTREECQTDDDAEPDSKTATPRPIPGAKSS
jgi:hypothetical protein